MDNTPKWIAVMNGGEAFVEQYRERSPGTGRYLATLTPEPDRAMRFTSPEEADAAGAEMAQQCGGKWDAHPAGNWHGLMSLESETLLFNEMRKGRKPPDCPPLHTFSEETDV